jgi:hypothetical protein
MTKHRESATAALDRPALTEVEITPAMVEAGFDVFCDMICWGGDRSGFYDDNGFVECRDAISRIYRAMAEAAESHLARA